MSIKTKWQAIWAYLDELARDHDPVLDLAERVSSLEEKLTTMARDWPIDSSRARARSSHEEHVDLPLDDCLESPTAPRIDLK